MLKDEPPTFEPLPDTHCHCSRRRRVVPAAIEKCTNVAKVSPLRTVHGQPAANLQEEYNRRCTMQQRAASRSTPLPPAAWQVVENEPVQRVRVVTTGSTAL